MDLILNNADLYGDNRIVEVDNLTIKYNDNDLLYVELIDDITKIKVDEQYKILVSNDIPETILSKLTNDYIEDETIDKIKIYNLTSDLLSINNNFDNFYNKLYIDNLISLYYSKIESDNLYYNKTYINSLIDLYYTKIYIDNLISGYYTKTQSDNLYYNKTYINSLIDLYYTKIQTDAKYALLTSLLLYYTKTESDNLYYSKSYINSLIDLYYTKIQSDNLYYNKTYINSNYTTTTSLNTLLNNKLDTSVYNLFITDLSLKFFSPLSSSNLRKSYLEYANLTDNIKYIFFSLNGVNQYQDINFINDGSLLASKLETSFYDNALYCYNNFVNSNGLLSLASLNPPSVSGTYYLRSFLNLAGLNQVSWVDVSTLSNNIVLPYTISTNISGYNSVNNGAVFKLSQTANPTTSTGIEIAFENTGQSNCYGSTGFNSSGRIVVNPSLGTFIQYPAPFCYAYSKSNYYIFCYNSLSSVVNVRIQCLDDIINIWSSLSMNNWDLNNVRKLYITDLYPNTTNQTYIKVNSDLQITNILKCDTLQAYNATNLITINNDMTYTNKNQGNINNIFCSIINANSVNNNLIKFNNTCDHQNNNIINYNLGSLTMLKTANTTIALKTSTNNTYVLFGVYANDDLGMNLGLYRDNSGVSNCYISMNKNFVFGTNLTTLYKIDYIASTSRHKIDFTNCDLSILNNGTLYTRYLRGEWTDGILNCYGLKMQSNINMNGYSLSNFSFPAANLTGSDSISVNTGAYNYLRKGNITLTNIQIFGMSANSFNLESNKGESSGISCDCDSDGITLYTPFDVNGVSIQDEDSSNTRIAYINSGGQFITTSTKTRKHSIKQKNNNNILERILKIKICSYGYKYEFNNDDTDKKKLRMINKSKKLNMGVILEEVYDILPNIIDKYDNSLDDKLIDDDNIKDKDITFKNKPKLEEIEDISNQGVDYTKLNLYHLMAFLEYVKKTNERIEKLEKLIYDNNIYNGSG